MDPRVQERRDEVDRIRRRRLLRAVATVVVVVVLGLGVLVALHSPVLAVRHVTIEGSVHTPRAELLDAAGLTQRPPMIDVSPGQIAQRLDALPWVGRAVVSRHWPDTVTFTITERVPVAAVVAGPGRWALVDRTGRVLATVATPPPAMVVLTSPAPVRPPGAVLATTADPGLDVAAQLPPVLVGRVHAVAVSATGAVTLDLGSGLSAVLGPDTDLAAKFEALASVLAAAPPRGTAQIDVTVPSAPAVGPPPPPPPSTTTEPRQGPSAGAGPGSGGASR
jgi:cell division protein FtsQ